MFDSFNKLKPNVNPPAGTEYKILKQIKMLRFFMDGIKLFSTDMLKTYAATLNEIQDVSVPIEEKEIIPDDLDSTNNKNNHDNDQ